MIISPHAQGSLEWMTARAGIPTASDFDNLVSPTGKVRTGEMPKTYLASKLAEAWSGSPLSDFNSWAMDQGNILEEEARPWAAFELGKEIKQVGLITTDDGRLGCSPDGLIGEQGVEIKSPQPTHHVKYLLNGTLPDDYILQVQCGMYVTGFESWLFISYNRRLPKLVLTIEKDEKIQAAIEEALEAFLDAFDAGWKHLCELNGGPPKRRAITPAKTNGEISLTYLQ